MLTILSDIELVEAITGAVGFFIAMHLYRGYFNLDWATRAVFIFPTVWIIRKISINIYKHIRESKNIKINSVRIPKF